jgi:hypothetical protein
VRPATFSLALTIGAVAHLGAAFAQPQVYEYRVEHPLYGEIGTYTNVVDGAGGRVDVRSSLHVAVKFLGLAVFRQDSISAEHWENGRLITFRSATTTNGDRTEVSGTGQEDGFMITRPTGTAVGPANLHPSNPWSANILGSTTLMSTKTGKLFNVRLGKTEEKLVVLRDRHALLREYQVVGEKRQVLWLDDEGTPVGFRTDEDGTPIDFILIRHAVGDSEPHLWMGPVPEIGSAARPEPIAGGN